MPRILTIDDSSTIRTIISKQMTELGFEIDQAEDGEQGLARLEEITCDLILLDVTMPVMDGPTMLAKLRERGDKTPVIMLTSESKRSIVSGAVKLGIEDYILKPFKPEELRGKVVKALRMDGSAPPPTSSALNQSVAAAPVAHAPVGGAAPARQFIDVLVVDDMENVHKKLRSMLPQHLSINACVSARDALQHCQDHVYRVVVIDMVIPDVNSVALMGQLRALQPHAVMVGLALRTANDAATEIKAQGFQDVLFKPFEAEVLEDFLGKYFDVKEVLSVENNILKCAGFEGKDDKVDRYFTRMKALMKDALEKLASACYEDCIFEMTDMPLRNDKIVRLIMEFEKDAKKLGIAIRVVGKPEAKKVLSSIQDTAAIPFFGSLNEAKDMAA
jgi:DNA-binding response OmpR family regulator